jgi:hypothetical protein
VFVLFGEACNRGKYLIINFPVLVPKKAGAKGAGKYQANPDFSIRTY